MGLLIAVCYSYVVCFCLCVCAVIEPLFCSHIITYMYLFIYMYRHRLDGILLLRFLLPLLLFRVLFFGQVNRKHSLFYVTIMCGGMVAIVVKSNGYD